jgi:hypothetical protein
MNTLRLLSVPLGIALGVTLLAGCGDTTPAAEPSDMMSEDAMMEESTDDAMEEDAMEEEG